MGVSKNLTVAIYGKGGAGKSFLTSMIAKELTARQRRVLQMGCDPKHDSVVTHFGGALIPTVLGTWAKFEAEGRADELAARRRDVQGRTASTAWSSGGPESARGCGGRGITFGFQLLEKWGLSEWNFHYMLLDFLGDVVCGGFGTPIARSMADKLIIVCSNEAPVDVRCQQHRLGGALFCQQRRPDEVPRPVRQQGRRQRQSRRRWPSGSASRCFANLPLIPQDEVMPGGVPHPQIASAVKERH